MKPSLERNGGSALVFERLADLQAKTTLEAALAYAAIGWPVFPCDPRQDPPGTKRRKSKKPLVPGADRDSSGNRIPHTGGLWRATTDEQQIRQSVARSNAPPSPMISWSLAPGPAAQAETGAVLPQLLSLL